MTRRWIACTSAMSDRSDVGVVGGCGVETDDAAVGDVPTTVDRGYEHAMQPSPTLVKWQRGQSQGRSTATGQQPMARRVHTRAHVKGEHVKRNL